MGKRFDINKPANLNKKTTKSTHPYPQFGSRQNYGRTTNNIGFNNQNTYNQSTNQYGEYDSSEDYDLPSSTNLTIKMPITMKVVLTIAIIAAFFFIFMIMVVVVGGGDGADGYLEAANRCTKVIVVDSDCDENGENCSNKYDGEIDVEDYIAGVVAAEIGVGPYNLDYYKIAAITARTYLYNNISSSCRIEGNATAQKYMDVEDSEAESMIIEAVYSTRGHIMVLDEGLVDAEYSSACVVDDNGSNYVLRYGKNAYEDPQFQEVPKYWDRSESSYPRQLERWYDLVLRLLEQLRKEAEEEGIEFEEPDITERECPGNNDLGLSQIGALYLLTVQKYTFEEVLKYYYGQDIEIKSIIGYTGEMVEGYITPINSSTCSSNFGCRKHPITGEYDYHTGLDLALGEGTPIYAAKDGEVIAVEKNIPGASSTQTYGNYVYIKHDDGTKTRYAHMKYKSIPSTLNVGTKVSQGALIGEVGATGAATGPHLHYEVYVNDQLVDPSRFVDMTTITNGDACFGSSISDSYCNR